ncbi:MAG: MopE-related protein, partial [Myxococcales bacterium]|nr:MopE-related protein [Myxococcales bacterium]
MLLEFVSPLEVPGQIDELRLDVVSESGEGMLHETFTLSEPFPQTYRIRPAEPTDEAVLITAAAYQGGVLLIRKELREAFVSGREVHVIIELLGGGDGGVDAGDGGVDAGDAGDGGVDAGCVGVAECDDGIPCTTDSCLDGRCESAPDDSLCAPGESCDPAEGCIRPCSTDSDCDDGLVCNGLELCMLARCVPGTAPSCDDAIECTLDGCDEGVGGCVFTPDDSVCDDLDGCNGLELCDPSLGCRAGEPPLCDDGTECTTDSCDPGAAGLCVFLTRDVDGDGFGDATCPASGGVPANDCDDSNPSIFPGAPDICNGVDDDCDGIADDGNTCAAGSTGMCFTACGTEGSRTCSASCSWSICSAPAEVCNGLDDDCNGACDDGFQCCQGGSVPCMTSCGSTGVRVCDGACSLGACEPPLELCDNGLDDDCDTFVDEGCGTPCTTNADCDNGLPCDGLESCFMGGCSSGRPPTCDDAIRCTVDTCDDALGGCVFTPDDRFCTDSLFCTGAETCDVALGCLPAPPPSCDDGDACTDDACGGAGVGMCLNTTRDADGDGFGDALCPAAGGVPNTDCDDTSVVSFPGAPELCNGADDNCDGSCDESFACCRGASGPCSTSCGTTGTRTCSAVCSWGICSPPLEICNGIDDDCNGACDDGFGCCAGASGACVTSCGSDGTRVCDGACAWGSCSPPLETCSGVDDDCDGLVDEDFACAAGTLETCPTSCGSTGTRSCDASCAWSVCAPPIEECNGVDDDCDGLVDEDFGCAVGASSSCGTSCGTTGTRSCTAGCSWGACAPPVEACNGLDDDCDSLVDEDFGCAVGATGACIASCGTTGTRSCDASCAWGACAPPIELCNGIDDDC